MIKSRIAKHLDKLAKANQKALATFITAGDPDLTTTAMLLPLLEKAGVDVIELGIPFSDPVADGATIQRSSERSLAAGTTLRRVLDMITTIRAEVSVPIVLMGYCNQFYRYGWQQFTADAVAAGLDGLLLVDLPPEEMDELYPLACKAGLDLIFLLTPTSDAERIALVSRKASGFIYYVTVAGVTGERKNISESLAAELKVVKNTVKLPVLAGFGISDPQQAAQVAGYADGVVVGSAIVKLFEQYQGDELLEKVTALVSDLKQAIVTPAENQKQ
ncbi:MAG: tryptophan synthase subunit alpha [Trichlorobacter sp.]|nr:tryptophan synthase subunit alpha [Trichlorobacter sp.]